MRLFLLAAAAAALLGACASTTGAYQERGQSSRYGYAEMQLEPNRVRVTYAGDTASSRETVETYLLYRAAETTLQRGYDCFLIVAHDAEADRRYQAIGGRPRLAGVSISEITSHNAGMDIVMFEGQRPAAMANAYDARAVTASLEPRIVRTAAR